MFSDLSFTFQLRALVLSLCLFLSQPLFASLHYSDYAAMRDEFHRHNQTLNQEVVQGNTQYIRSLKNYQQCSSDKWRVTFTSVVPEIDKRRLALDKYKRNALQYTQNLNSEWLRTAKSHNISRVKADQDISDFILWYREHINLVKQGPSHELEVYTIALSRLTKVYNTMALACEGDPEAAKNYSIFESGRSFCVDKAIQ